MKYTCLILLLFTIHSTKAQVNGNKQLETKFYPIEEVVEIDIQLYAKVIIDMAAPSGITITGESNLLDLINKKVKGGILTLDQKEWIEPTVDIKIEIGAPNLKIIEKGTHDKAIVRNIVGENFTVNAPMGELVLSGAVKSLKINSKMSKIDASDLLCEDADVTITNDGEVVVNASSRLQCDMDEDARVVNVNEAGEQIGCKKNIKSDLMSNAVHRFIYLKIKNNSLKRSHFVVVGPKPNGKKFSYGFALLPYQSKNERWTVGTKIYKESAIGERKLLVTLTEADENQTVKLFD